MKRLYVILSLGIILAVLMIFAAFYYLDLQRHQISNYAIYRNGILIGFEKIDRYILENSLIYKSVAEYPVRRINRKILRRSAFDIRGKDIRNYKKESFVDGSSEVMLINKSGEGISFVSKAHAEFAFQEDVPVYGNDLPFEPGALVTYPPVIKRYNFKKMGEQYVNVLIPADNPLPPARNTLRIQPIGKDVVETEGRRIDCERFALRLKNGYFISVWLTGNSHKLVMVEIPKDDFKAIFESSKKEIDVKSYAKKSSAYEERDIVFISDDIELSGTLSVPSGNGAPYPAIILLWGEGPMDRNAGGLFTDMASAFAEAGFCVLRFDKRGIGKSQGFYSTYTHAEAISDIERALTFLKESEEADNERIALAGYSQGAFYASYVTSRNNDVAACIMLSPVSSLSYLSNDCHKLKRLINNASAYDEEYREKALESFLLGSKIAEDITSDWITVLNERVFTKNMRDERRYNVLDAMAKVEAPMLILHGSKDAQNPVSDVRKIENALAGSEKSRFTTIYFGELNHSLGAEVKYPPVEDHYEMDKEVIGSALRWLKDNVTRDVNELERTGEETGEGKEVGMPSENPAEL